MYSIGFDITCKICRRGMGIVVLKYPKMRVCYKQMTIWIMCNWLELSAVGILYL